MTAIVAYYRVSTRKQGLSGLGLEGQQAAVEAHCRQSCGRIVASYIEVESGKKADRVELAKALSHSRRGKAVLVIAKLDRLSRDPDFLGALMKAGIEFVACDMPNATKLTIRIMAAVAEDELRRISERTKAALAAAKARGTLLGSARPGHWNGRENQRLAGLEKARKVAIKVRQQKAAENYADLVPNMIELRKGGATLQGIAEELNKEGHTTRRGKPWNQMQVSRVLERVEVATPGR